MISLLVVNYRSAALAFEAIRSARAATAQPLQVVAVDNSCDPAEAAALRSAADVLLTPAQNLGYAGAINLGRKSCDGKAIVVSNPDVVFAPGSIDMLVAQLDGRTAVAGPALFWDDAHEWLLPPADRNSGWQKLDEVLASRSRAWAVQRDRRRVQQRLRFWSRTEPAPVRTLSGAVLAIRAGDFDELGGFDERFFLYFEETDFLRRVEERRKRIVYVPAARCRHLFNQSAGQSGDSSALYARSEVRYLEKWNGPLAARVLKRLERPALQEPVRMAETLELDRDDLLVDLVVEASPLASFATAAGHFPRSREVALPPEVRASFKGETLYLRAVVRSTGEELIRIQA